MNDDAVAALYDGLFAFESRWKGRRAYPMHKQLRFPDGSAAGVYDWAIRRLRVPANGLILDAGCGVGFGTLTLARGIRCRVYGISLSNAEVQRARENVESANLQSRVSIDRGSYDNLAPARYDAIVAVESAKHSADLSHTLGAMKRALRSRGQLLIVEDVYSGPADHRLARELVRDWRLVKLYRHADYVDVLGRNDCEVVDLTATVQRPAHWKKVLQRLALQSLLAFEACREKVLLQTFRGGHCLDRLYAEGLMHYKAIVYSKKTHGH